MSNDTDTTPQRPACLEDDMLEYLDDLRESGVTNMMGAGPYVQDEYGLSRNEARDVVLYWMRTFSDRQEGRL